MLKRTIDNCQQAGGGSLNFLKVNDCVMKITKIIIKVACCIKSAPDGLGKFARETKAAAFGNGVPMVNVPCERHPIAEAGTC
jgi:hypothetical protein